MESRQHTLTGLLLAIVIVAVIAGWQAWADYFPAPVGYPTVNELGTIANGGTVTCSFRNAPICHFTVAAGSGGFTIASPSSNPPVAGQVVTLVWQQAAAGFPVLTWGNAWYGFNGSVVRLNTLPSALTVFMAYSNAATGVAAMTFEWDGTEYVLGVPQTLLSDTIVGYTNIYAQTKMTLNGNFAMSSVPNGTSYIIAFNQPSISSGFGSGASTGGNVGTKGFTVNVGTGGSASSGVLGFNPVATTGWHCHCDDVTTQSATVFVTKQTASATNSCTIGNFNTAGTAAAWVASDTLVCEADGY